MDTTRVAATGFNGPLVVVLIGLGGLLVWAGTHWRSRPELFIRYCDEFASLQACHDDIAGSAGMMFISPGTYLLTSQLNISKDGVQMIGAGRGVTIIQRGTFSSDTTTVVLTGNNNTVRDLTFDGNGTATSFALLGMSGTYATVDNISIVDNENLGLSGGIVGLTVTNSLFDGLASASSGSIGLWFDASTTRDTIISNNIFKDQRLGGVYGHGVNIVVSNNTFTNNHCQTSPEGGGQIAISDFAINDNILIANNTINAGCASATSGIEIDGRNVAVVGNMVESQQNHGVVLQNADNILVSGNTIKNSGVDGILVAAGVSGFQITNNKIFDDQGSPTQDWGVNIVSGSSDNFIIANNDLRGNVNGGISDGATGTSRFVFNNTTVRLEVE